MDVLTSLGMQATHLPFQTIVVRLLVAGVLGGVIGFERETSLHSAGLRTHILIALAAALYTIITLEIFYMPDVLAQGRSDPGRAVDAVTAGIAFLGAGAIFRGSNRPRGLTTGAGIWLAGAVGMTAALGYYLIGLAVVVFALLVLTAAKALDTRIDARIVRRRDPE